MNQGPSRLRFHPEVSSRDLVNSCPLSWWHHVSAKFILCMMCASSSHFFHKKKKSALITFLHQVLCQESSFISLSDLWAPMIISFQFSSPDDYKGLDLIDRVPEELWMEVHDIVQEAGIKTIPKEKKCKKGKTVVWGGLINSCEKKRSKRQRRKGKIYPFECRVPKNSKER